MGSVFSKVSTIGLGYIGLPTAAVLANYNVEVVGIDVNKDVVDSINRGKVHIVEPDLDSMVNMAVINNKLRASVYPEAADAFIIAVPTPFKGSKEPDITYVKAAAMSIAPVLKKGNLVILESTSPVGTTEELSEWLAGARNDLSFPHTAGEKADVNIAYCPERVLPGKILRELVENDRIIGGLTMVCAQKAAALYRIFVRGECIITSARTAEMTKLTENAYRDLNIAFANELSIICDGLGINVWELIEMANRHPRVKILQPGPGVGGHCIAVDPWFIVHSAPETAKLIKTAREVNDNKPAFVISKIREKVGSSVAPVIACLGLAFKADIDDMRESPAVRIVAELAMEKSWHITAVEPYVDELPATLKKFPNVELATAEKALERADIIVILVGHRQFKEIDRRLLGKKAVIDTCGLLRK